MRLIDLYTEYIANWISSGKLVNRDKMSLLGIRPLYDRYLSYKSITKVWCIFSLPVRYDFDVTQALRQELFKMHPSVKTIIHMYNSPVNVNVKSEQFRRQLKSIANRYNTYKGLFNSLTDDQRLTGVSEIDPRTGRRVHMNRETLLKMQEEYDSYMYVFDSEVSGDHFNETYYFIQASCDSTHELNKYKKTLENLLIKEDILFQELHGTIGQYLDNFCPGTFISESPRKITPMLFSTENVVSQIPCNVKGLIGKKGILLGKDCQTNLPFLIDFYNSGFAQIIMLLAKSGSGKTYMSFIIALWLCALDVHCSAIDIKGNEWYKLCAFVNAIVIDMSGENSKFVNLLRLDDVEDITNPEEVYQYAVDSTVRLLELMINLQPNEGNQADLIMILNKAVAKVYSNHQVSKNNAKTFKNTASIFYDELLPVFSVLERSASFNAEQRKICNLARTRCSSYFLGEGKYSSAFKNELTMQDILNTPMVIYSFNKNSDSSLDILDTIRVYMAQRLDGKKHTYRKQHGLHSAAFYEELQRCQQLGKLVDFISQKVTGSRSDNVIIFLLLNAVSTFNNPEFAAIRSNITTKIVGKVDEEDISILSERFGCESIANYLKAISENRMGNYSHAFAIQYDTGLDRDKALIKTIIPDYVSEVFQTRDTKE